MDATMEEIMDACRQANAHDFIAKLPNGYRTPIGIGGVRLSGGQCQRLAIARALLRRPRILLLDEATSALDGESERLVQVALDRARHGRTTLTIAHRLSTIRNVDRIIVLEQNGRIAECGTHDQLMARAGGVYRQMAIAQHMDAAERILLRKNLIDETKTREENEVLLAEEDVHTDGDPSAPSSESNGNIGGKYRSFKTGLSLPNNPATSPNSKRKRSSFFATLAYLRRVEVVIVIFGVASAVLMGSAWPLFSLLYGRMFAALSVGDASSVAVAVRANALFYIAVGTMGAVTTFLSGALLSYVGETFSMRLRMAVFKAIDQRLAGVIGAFVSLLLGMALGFYYGWEVACGGMAITIVLVVVELSVLRVLKRRGIVDIAVAERSANIACEAIENVRTIQMLVREDYLCEMFETESTRSRQRGLFRALLQSVTYAINYSFAQLVSCVCYALGVSLVIRSVISPFTVFQVTEALISAGFAIMRCAAYLPEYLRARLSAAEMTALIGYSSRIDALGEGGRSEPIRGELEVRDVRFAYPTRQQHAVLDGLSFRATAGATVALVGQSGCGKTTVIQLLERFYDVGAGSIRVDGVDVREYNVGHLRAAIALVSQEPTLFNLSIRDNIAYGMRGDETSIMDAARMANVDEFVQRLPMKYDTLVGGKGAQLSGGQRQRIAIARAIARQPRVLLLDEATSALDANSEKAVQEAMDSARVGRTCVVIAHRLSTIRNADLIVVMDGGRVAESGTHAELVARGGQYARLVAAGGTATDAASP